MAQHLILAVAKLIKKNLRFGANRYLAYYMLQKLHYLEIKAK